MANKPLQIITIETEINFSLEELCEVCQTNRNFILEVIEFGGLEPKGKDIADWQFDLQHLKRIKKLLNLQKDLEINLAGAVLAIDLMDEVDRMRRQLKLLQELLGPR